MKGFLRLNLKKHCRQVGDAVRQLRPYCPGPNAVVFKATDEGPVQTRGGAATSGSKPAPMPRLSSRGRVYVAELGQVGFAAVGIFVVLAVVAEFLDPGFVFNHVAPKAILVVGVVFGALSLLDRPKPLLAASATPLASGLARRRLILGVVVGGLLTLAAFSAAWYYWASVPADRLKLSLAAGLIMAMTFWSAVRRSGTVK